MARQTQYGTFYTTDDLIKMARLESFGQYSTVLLRALQKLKQLEQDNNQLKELLKQSDIKGKVISNLEG